MSYANKTPYALMADGTLIDWAQSLATGVIVTVPKNDSSYAPRTDVIELPDGTLISEIATLLANTGGSGGGVTIAQVNALIKLHDENLAAHEKLIYKQDITALANTWTIQHNLETEWYNLSITCLDNNQTRIIGEIDTVTATENMFQIKFEKAFTGKVIIKK